MKYQKKKYFNILQCISTISLFISIMVLPMSSYSQKGLELSDYQKTAAENNADLKSQFTAYKAALEKIPQVGTLPDISIMFGYFVLPMETRTGTQRFNLSATQMFPWFGKLNAQEQMMAEMAKSKYEAFINSRNMIFYKVASLYNDWYVLRKNISINKEKLELLHSFRELAKIKFESGKSGFVDVLRVDMEIAELENQLQYLLDSEKPYATEFRELLNASSDTLIVFPDTLQRDSLLMDISAIKDSSIAQNPRLKEIDHMLLSWQQQLKAARKSGLPSFSLGLTYTYMTPRTDMDVPDNGRDALMPQVGITLPIYRGKYNAMKNEAELMQQSYQQKKESVTNKLETETDKNYRDYLDAKRRLDLFRKLEQLANQAKGILLESYSTSGKDFEEVLRMERVELQYALALEQARADLNTSIAYLNYLMAR